MSSSHESLVTRRSLCRTVRGVGYNTDGSLARLQLIANECYSTQVRAIIIAPLYTKNPYRPRCSSSSPRSRAHPKAWYFSAKAFDVLERLDPNPEYWEGKRGAAIGCFQKVRFEQFSAV